MNLRKHIGDFISIVQQSDEIELYNEAGFQHELAIFLRSIIGDRFKVQLERNIRICCDDPKVFCKKEMDIYIVDRKDPDNRYCIELKLTHGRAIPRRMFQAFEDILFLEQLKFSGFRGCYLLFATPQKLFWNQTRADQKLRKAFYDTEISFQSLVQNDAPDFLRTSAIDSDILLPIKGQYKSTWNDLKVQEKKQWRYFMVEV